MDLFFNNTEKTPIVFKSEASAGASYPALPGSRCLLYQTAALLLEVKVLAAPLFTIRYKSFRFAVAQALEARSALPGLHTRVMLENDVRVEAQDIGSIHQQPNTIAAIWSKAIRCTAFFEKDKQYRCLDIFATPSLVESMVAFFPELKDLLERKGAAALLKAPLYLSPQLREVVNQILDCPYDQKTAALYFDIKVREYLYLLLHEGVHAQPKQLRLTPYDRQQLEQAKRILLQNLSDPPLTIGALARTVALNEFKLKTGFKQLFGTGIFECFHRARMQKARSLLLNSNRPLKDICQEAGYQRMTNFITAFRKFYGYTPGSLRRQ